MTPHLSYWRARFTLAWAKVDAMLALRLSYWLARFMLAWAKVDSMLARRGGNARWLSQAGQDITFWQGELHRAKVMFHE
jgi:hypothetical protein